MAVLAELMWSRMTPRLRNKEPSVGYAVQLDENRLRAGSSVGGAEPLQHGIKAYYTFAPAPNPLLVDFFLREKGVNVAAIEVHVDLPNLENRSAFIYARNAQGGLPLFELEDGTSIAETVAMCEYVEERLPLPAL
eukprot:331485-Prymnesium_polylepis.1